MDFFTRLVGRTLGQKPVAQPLVAPRFATGPAIAADTASEVEAEAGRPESPDVFTSRGPSAFSPDSATRPPLVTVGVLQQTVPASSEQPFADEGEQPNFPLSALKPGVAAHEHPPPAARRAAYGRAKPKPVQASGNQLVQGEGDSQVFGQAGSITLRPAQPDGLLEREHQSDVSSRSIVRDQPPGSSPEFERLRQTPEETFESRGAVRTLLPEQSVSGGSEEAPTLLDVCPSVTTGSIPVGSISEGRTVIRPEVSPQPPTIRVTIGRVEVRAIMPPAPAPAFAPPARHEPLLSLDDYLKQRDEGQR